MATEDTELWQKIATWAKSNPESLEKTLTFTFDDAKDSDGDGLALDQEELKIAFEALCNHTGLKRAPDPSKMDELFKAIDPTESGMITFDQWRAFVKGIISTHSGVTFLPQKIAEKKQQTSGYSRAPALRYRSLPVVDSLTALFQSIDLDGDGYVSAEELQVKLDQDDEIHTLLDEAGGFGFASVMHQLDRDKDGQVTLEEFKSVLGGEMIAAAMATNEGTAVLRELFMSLDTDGDGTVSNEEWSNSFVEHKDILMKFFKGLTMDDMGAAFKGLDANGDGTLTWEEFVQATTPHKEKAGLASRLVDLSAKPASS